MLLARRANIWHGTAPGRGRVGRGGAGGRGVQAALPAAGSVCLQPSSSGNGAASVTEWRRRRTAAICLCSGVVLRGSPEPQRGASHPDVAAGSIKTGQRPSSVTGCHQGAPGAAVIPLTAGSWRSRLDSRRGCPFLSARLKTTQSDGRVNETGRFTGSSQPCGNEWRAISAFSRCLSCHGNASAF